MATIGGDDTLLWIALPIVVFLAGYTPGAVNFVVGQASFTVFVVVLFNVLVPEGWRTGLVRVQDVAIGAGHQRRRRRVLWPRGARRRRRRAFADLLRAGTGICGSRSVRPRRRVVRRASRRRGRAADDARAGPRPRSKTSRSSTAAGTSTARRGPLLLDPSCSVPATASPAGRRCPAGVLCTRPGPRSRRRVARWHAGRPEPTASSGPAPRGQQPRAVDASLPVPPSGRLVAPTPPTASTARWVWCGCTSGWPGDGHPR